MSPLKRWISHPENLFLLIGFLAGSLLAVFVPYGAGFDEETHLVRVFDISRGYLLPNRSAPQSTRTFRAIYQLSYQRRYLQTPAWDLLSTPLSEVRGDPQDMLKAQTRSVYNPLMFLPQALVSGVIWRLFSLPIVSGTILLRLTGLVFYLGAIWLAIRLIPVGKTLFALLALAPAALFQAATINTDGYTIALSFLFLAAVLWCYRAPQAMTPRQAAGLSVVILLLGCAKPGAVVLLPILIFLPWKRIPNWLRAVIGAAGVISVVINIGWMSLAAANSHLAAGGDQDLSRQMALILAQPGMTLLAMLSSLLGSVGSWLQDWIGVYGHWAGTVPQWVFILYPLALILAFFSAEKPDWLRARQRVLLVAVFILSVGAVAGAYFVANYDPQTGGVVGRQGRYLLPLAPLLFWSVLGLVDVPILWKSRLKTGAFLLLGGSLLFFGWGVYATYYQYCGSLAYQPGICLQPAYKNLDRDALPEYLVSTGEEIQQTYRSHCAAVGGAEVFLRAPDAQGARVQVLVLDEAGNVLASREEQLAGGVPGAYMRLEHPAQPAQDKMFTYEVTVLAGSLRVPVSEGDFIPGGGGLINQEELPGDTVFHYLCVSPALLSTR